MKAELDLFFSTFVSLFVIVDPFGVVPLFASFTANYTAHKTREVCLRACLLGGIILVIFCLTGMAVFELFGITIPAFQIAGGLLLFRLGLEQLEAERKLVNNEEQQETGSREDISLFPLATPLLAGPGSISTVVLQSGTGANWRQKIITLLALVAVLFCVYWILRIAPLILKRLGHTGINLISKIMGLLLVAISVQFVIAGLQGVWKLWSLN